MSWVFCLAIYPAAASEVRITFVYFLLSTLTPTDAQDAATMGTFVPRQEAEIPRVSNTCRLQTFLSLWRDSAKEHFLEHSDLGGVMVHPELGRIG